MRNRKKYLKLPPRDTDGSQSGFYKPSVKPSHSSISGARGLTRLSVQMCPLPGLTPIHPGRDHSGRLTQVRRGKLLFTGQARRPVCGRLDNGPSTHKSLPTSSPSGPETAAPLVEQGHLWLGCDEGPEVGSPQEHVCEPEAVTVPGRQKEEGRASTGAGRGLSGRGEG